MVLPRYDGNTLRPLRPVGDPGVSIFPRLSLPGDGHLHEMNLLNRSTGLNPAFQPPGTYGHQTGQIHQGLLPGSITAADDADPDWESILHNIQEIGIHRFLTLIKKVPAIGLLLISLWIVWGRGFNTVLEDVEKIWELLDFDLHSKPEAKNFAYMTVNERTAHAGALTGVGLLIAIFSLLSLAFGISALMKVNKAEHKVKEAKRRQRSVEYLNPAYGAVEAW
uniref:Uncharacterized protein n=1 Tax=Panagrolaimus sp. PS1159 TaxID=55785 RepID=A0AC35ERW6_9BILA